MMATFTKVSVKFWNILVWNIYKAKHNLIEILNIDAKDNHTISLSKHTHTQYKFSIREQSAFIHENDGWVLTLRVLKWLWKEETWIKAYTVPSKLMLMMAFYAHYFMPKTETVFCLE